MERLWKYLKQPINTQKHCIYNYSYSIDHKISQYQSIDSNLSGAAKYYKTLAEFSAAPIFPDVFATVFEIHLVDIFKCG